MSQKGFTLVELMITIVIMAVLMGLAAPNLTQLLRDNRAASEVNTFAGMFAYARREAVQRAQTVRLVGPLAVDGSWEVLRHGDGLQLRIFPALASYDVSPAGQKTILFDSRGQAVGAAAISFDLIVKAGTSNCATYNRTIVVELSGAASVRKRGC